MNRMTATLQMAREVTEPVTVPCSICGRGDPQTCNSTRCPGHELPKVRPVFDDKRAAWEKNLATGGRDPDLPRGY